MLALAGFMVSSGTRRFAVACDSIRLLIATRHISNANGGLGFVANHVNSFAMACIGMWMLAASRHGSVA